MGYLRLLLCASVLFHHLSPVAASQWWGTAPVLGFYTLAGFLITHIIKENYGNSLRGKALFLYNRFLRLYPIYFTCLVISISVVLLIGRNQLAPAMRLPGTFWEWLPQLTIIGLNGPYPGSSNVRLVVAAWSLDIELVHYLLIGLLLGYSRRLCFLWFLCALLLTTYWAATGEVFIRLYRSWLGPTLAFALGSVCYHWRIKLLRFTIPPWQVAWFTSLALVAGSMSMAGGYSEEAAWLGNFAGVFLFAPLMLGAYRRESTGKVSAFSRWCGDVSYPVFLIHWQVGALVLHTGLFEEGTWPFFSVSVLATLSLAVLLVACVDQPLKPLRDGIRNHARAIRKQRA
jgi:peptidoglycan/LPS O-acetylase OafA/YrhL